MSDASPIAELQRVVLTADLPEHGLKAGDVGTVVHAAADDRGYIVEFTTLAGNTAAVASVIPGQIRPVDEAEITHARRRAG
jgi:hypothetical protein